MKNTSLVRNSNFELLRIFAMLGIIISHISIHGLYLTKEIIPDSTMLQIIQGFFSLGSIGNCIFMLLSGYFLCTSTFKPIKILELWLQLLFYSVAIAAFIYIFNLDIFVAGNEYYNSPDYNLFVKKINKLNAVLSFFPILTNKNWYISVYLGFYAFLPFFQIIDRNIDQKKHLYLLGLLFFFNILFPSIFPFGDVAAFYYNRISLFIFYFYVGSYLKKYSNNKIENLYLCIAVALVSLTIIILRPFFISNIIGASFSNNPYFGFFFENNSLFTMLFVVSIFNIFKKIQISSKIINFISAGTLAVYLIHDNAMMRLFLWRKLFKVQDFQNNQYLVIYIVFVAVLVLICFSLIDILRRFIFNIFTKNK